jgi:hypothetical protein
MRHELLALLALPVSANDLNAEFVGVQVVLVLSVCSLMFVALILHLAIRG